MQPFASAAISFDCPEEQYGIPQASGLYAVPCPPIVDPIQVGGTIATASAGAVQPAPGRVVRALLAEMPRHAPGEPCASAAGIERRKAAYRRDLLAYFAEIWARILLTADLYAWLEYAGQVGVSGYALRDRDVHLALLATLPANLHSDVRDMLPGLRDRSSLIAWDVLGAPLDAEERAMEDALVARDEAEERARIVARTPITKSTEDMIVLEITSDSDNRPRWLIELLDRVRPLELEGRNVILYQRPELLKRLTWGTIEHRCFRILASDSTVTGRPAELVANQGACPDIIERILSKRDGVDRRTIDPAEQKDARSSEGRKRIAQLREIVRPVAPMLLSAHALNPAYSKLVASLAVRGLLLEPDAAFFVIQAELQDCWRKTHQQTIVHPDIQVRLGDLARGPMSLRRPRPRPPHLASTNSRKCWNVRQLAELTRLSVLARVTWSQALLTR